MNKKRGIKFLILFLIILIGQLHSRYTLCENTNFALADDIYFSLLKFRTNSGVIADNKDILCDTSSEMLAAMALIERGHFNRARRIIDFYDEIYADAIKSENGFVGFGDLYEIKSRRHYIVEIGTVSYKNGFKPSHFANVCVSVAALNYRIATGDKRFDGLIKSIANLYLKNIDAWGLYKNSDGTNPLIGNLAAYTTLVCAASLEKFLYKEKEKSLIANLPYILKIRRKDPDEQIKIFPSNKGDYLISFKRLRTALVDMFYDEKNKVFRRDWKDVTTFADEDENLFAHLILGEKDFPYNKLVENYTADNRSKNIRYLSCVAMLLSSSGIVKNKESVKETIDYIGNFLMNQKGSSEFFIFKNHGGNTGFFKIGYTTPTITYDIFTTAVYALALDGKNPFKVISSAIEKDAGIIGEEFLSLKIDKGEKWQVDTFEKGEEAFYLSDKPLIRNADILPPPEGLFADGKIKKSGDFSLKIRFITRPASSGDKVSQGGVSRFFYPAQDFLSYGNFSSVKCWINARPATFTLGVTNLKIRLRLTDSEGVSADSKNLNYSGRGVENTISFPSGLTPVSPLKAPDYRRIKKITFLFEEDTQTSWDINVDDLRIE